MRTEIQKAWSHTDYQAQAQAFLDRFRIKFRATLSDSKVAPWTFGSNVSAYKSEPHHYRVTLSRKWYTRDGKSHNGRIVFDFWASITDAEKGIKTVTPYDVLARISSDASMDTEFTGFGEWCDNYSFDRDSIRALQTYRRCSAFTKRLQAFFTKEEIEALQEIQ